MGQRLVITVHAFDEDIATIYYHWSAYTTSALDEAQKILKKCQMGRYHVKGRIDPAYRSLHGVQWRVYRF